MSRQPRLAKCRQIHVFCDNPGSGRAGCSIGGRSQSGHEFSRLRHAKSSCRHARGLARLKCSFGGVAQLVEQRNHNPRVRGSNPCAAKSPRDCPGLGWMRVGARPAPHAANHPRSFPKTLWAPGPNGVGGALAKRDAQGLRRARRILARSARGARPWQELVPGARRPRRPHPARAPVPIRERCEVIQPCGIPVPPADSNASARSKSSGPKS